MDGKCLVSLMLILISGANCDPGDSDHYLTNAYNAVSEAFTGTVSTIQNHLASFTALVPWTGSNLIEVTLQLPKNTENGNPSDAEKDIKVDVDPSGTVGTLKEAVDLKLPDELKGATLILCGRIPDSGSESTNDGEDHTGEVILNNKDATLKSLEIGQGSIIRVVKASEKATEATTTAAAEVSAQQTAESQVNHANPEESVVAAAEVSAQPTTERQVDDQTNPEESVVAAAEVAAEKKSDETEAATTEPSKPEADTPEA